MTYSIQQAADDIDKLLNHDTLGWFRNYVRQLEKKYPNPDSNTSGWIGNMWDMIKMAGKEDVASLEKYDRVALEKILIKLVSTTAGFMAVKILEHIFKKVREEK